MNICFITARILENPKRVLKNNIYCTYFKISFPHKRKLFCYAYVIVYGQISQNVFDLYIKGDYIIIEGKLLISKSMNNTNLIIHVTNLHPAYIIMQK